MTHDLAQVNIACLHQPLDHPQIRDFVEGLAPINALAEAAPASSGGCRTRPETRRPSPTTPTPC